MNYSGNQAWNPTFLFILAWGTNEYIFRLCYKFLHDLVCKRNQDGRSGIDQRGLDINVNKYFLPDSFFSHPKGGLLLVLTDFIIST